MADNVTGIVLDIPTTVLDNIKKADEAITKLEQTSQKAAQNINRDFGSTMVSGVEAFIKKVQEAQSAIGDLNVNVNVKNVSAPTLAQDIAQSVKSISELILLLSQVGPKADSATGALGRASDEIKRAFSYEAGKNIDGLATAIDNINKKLRDGVGGVTPRADEQYLVNLRARYQEELKILNQSDQKKAEIAAKDARRSEAAKNRDDNKVLIEQNRLLNERLKIQRQLGNIAVVETKNTILGNKPLNTEQIEVKADLSNRLKEIDDRLAVLGARYDSLGEKAQKAFDTRNTQGYIAWQQETIKNEENIAKARVRANELLKSSGNTGLQPTSEELSAQRQLTTLYSQKLAIEKEIQKVNNQVALQSQGASAAQQQYLSYLNSQSATLSNEISTVANKYAQIGKAVGDKYAEEWLRMQERAAYDLAQAQEKVNQANAKSDTAKKIAEYKKLVAENERLAKSMRDYVAAAGSAPVATDTSASAQAYRDMYAQWATNEQQRRNLSAQGIAEIAELERQAQLKSAQESVAAFVQAEMQKKAALQQSINEESAARKKAYEQYTTTYEGAIKYASKDSRTDTYEKREVAIKNVEEAIKKLSTSDSDYAQKMQQLTDILEKLKTAQKAVSDELRRKPKVTANDAFKAVDVAKATKSLESYQNALKMVKAAMANIDSNSSQWESLNRRYSSLKDRINEIKNKMGEFKNASRSLGDVAGQLQRKLALVFSVSAIRGYIDKIVQVRAQFELQQTALRAILQDKDKADRIFMQVQQLALQSPFSIMQMTTFTKQLAAYRIESEKLVGTTKMLADVSAGLGVDMGRLILAYGQVKSANYLRACLGKGTKVKMFDGTFKRVEEVALSDLLMGDDELPRHVSTLYQGTQQMYRVSYEGGEFRCNEHHILTVYDALDMRVSDVFVLDYLKEPLRYQGVKRINGEYQTFKMKVEKDTIDTYYGFSIDGNKRFIIEDNIVTHNTEVRQFTEAGLNIAGELATYFSEVEGRLVSVADVMDRITRRMVTFGDVEEVFNRVTSAGGLFYDMQKKQSETLWGQLQRLKDAMSLALNDIGKDNQKTINRFLECVRELLQEWRELMPLVKAFGAAIAANVITKGVIGVARTLNQIWVTLGRITSLQALWNSLSKANVWGAILGILASIVTYIIQAKNATSALAAELENIRTESAEDLAQSVADFHQLARVITDITKSYTEREEALKSLNRAYKDILPSYMLEAEWLEEQINKYDAAIAKIHEYFQAKEMQKQIDTILSSDDYDDAVKEMKELGEELLNDGIFDVTVTKQYVDAWMNQIATEIASGKLKNSAEAVSKRLTEIYGKDIQITNSQWSDISEHFENINSELNHIILGTATARNQADLFARALQGMSPVQILEKIRELNKALKEQQAKRDVLVAGLWTTTGSSKNEFERQISRAEEEISVLNTAIYAHQQALANAYGSEIANEVNDQIDRLKREIQNVHTLKVKYNELQRTNTGTEEEAEAVNELSIKLREASGSVVSLAGDMGITLSNAELANVDNMFEMQRLMEDITKKAFPKLSRAAVDELSKSDTAVKSVINSIDWLKRTINSFAVGIGLDKVFEELPSEDPSKTEEQRRAEEELWKIERKRNEDYIKAAAKRAGIDENLINQNADFVLSKGMAKTDYAKNLRAKAKEWKNLQASVASMTEEQRKFYFESNHLSQRVVDQRAKTAAALEDIANAYDPQADKNSPKGKDPWIEIFTQRTKAVQDFYKQYETLRERFSEDESQRRAISSFKDYFEGVGLNMDEVISRGWDVSGLIGNLEEIEREVREHFGGIYNEAQDIMNRGLSIDAVVNPSARQKAAHSLAKMLADLQKQTADNKIKLDFEVQSENEKNIKDILDEMFANYNLTQELGKLGIDVNLAYMVDGKPVTLDDIRAQIEKLREDSGGDESSKNLVKIYEEYEKKLTEIEHKNAIERVKNYQKYLLQSMSERVQIELKAQQDINKIRNEDTLDDFSKEQAINNRRQEMLSELAKFDFDQLKGSDVFLQVMKDLEKASRKSLQYVINKLRELKAVNKDLSPEQIKTITSELNKYEKALAQRPNGLFSNLGAAIKYAIERNSLLAEQVRLQEEVDLKQQERSDAEKRLNELIQERDALTDADGAMWAAANLAVEIQQKKVRDIIAKLKELGIKIQGITDDIEAGEDGTDGLSGDWAVISEILNEISSSIGNISDGLSNMGMLSDSLADSFESTQSIAGDFVQVGAGAVQALTDPTPWGKMQGAIAMVGGAVKLIGDIFAIGDKKKERQIQRLQDKIEDLQRAYEKLGTAIEDAFTFDEYNAGFTQSMKNIREQRIAIQEQIALEESKKKTDKDKIQEYKDELDDLIEKEKELREARYEAMGSLSDSGVFDEAEDFVSIWLDAYKETGDGLDALAEHWDEFLENLVLKQAASAVVSKRMQKYIQRINDAIDRGSTGLSLAQTFATIGTDLKSELADWNEDLKAFFDAVGIDMGQSELLLSDLQKGIQNITEPQAAAIEAYLNSMRFAVFEQNTILSNILTAIQEQYGTSADNPVLQEVKAIRTLVASIDNRLSKVIVARGSVNSGYAVKVN